MSRKVSHDFDSAGYTVALDGEIPHATDDAEAVLEKVSELFHLAEEALAVEIERDQGRHASSQSATPAPPPPPKSRGRSEPLPMNRPASSNGTSPQAATPRQLQFLQNLGKRKGLSREDLDAVMAQVLGSAKLTGELTKREAGQVIDHLTTLQPEGSR
ncbi:MAG TPA: hypothetical protein VH092_35870 [Urbifossiella sp.]|nr:hypothetical protein [Urbifossiella sp.]